jgi:hypothetical protein
MLESLNLSCNTFFIVDSYNVTDFTDNILPQLQFLDISTKLLTLGESLLLSNFSGNDLPSLTSLNFGSSPVSVFSSNMLSSLKVLDLNKVQYFRNNVAPLLSALTGYESRDLLAFDNNTLGNITSLSFGLYLKGFSYNNLTSLRNLTFTSQMNMNKFINNLLPSLEELILIHKNITDFTSNFLPSLKKLDLY